MTSPCPKSISFLEKGTPEQFAWILEQYDKCLRIKAEAKSKKPDNIIALDKWYQNELPKKIKSRGKDAHLTHEELVQTIKWKLARGKFRPNLVNLVQMNTPRIVVQETKKGFRNVFKKENLESAMSALCNLKGVGPAMASAVLAAGAPHLAPFMADEVLYSLPDLDCLDYTMKEYMRMVGHIQTCVDRLNSLDKGDNWTPHKVELAIWTHFIAADLKPEILLEMPGKNPDIASNSKSENGSNDSKEATENKEEGPEKKKEEEEDKTKDAESSSNGNGDSQKNGEHEETKPVENGGTTNGNSTEGSEDTNDSTKENDNSSSTTHLKRPHDEESNGNNDENTANEASADLPANEEEPAAKKLKEQQMSAEAVLASN